MSADIFGLGSMSPVAAIIISVALMLYLTYGETKEQRHSIDGYLLNNSAKSNRQI